MAKVLTEHYSVYPSEKLKPVWAYAFRPMFILLPLYMSLSVLIWAAYFLGWINLAFLDNSLHWHIYELLFGVGSAGIVAFLLTAVPEMFPGAIPVVGKKLKGIIGLWLAGRLSFWLIDFSGVYLTGFLNIALLCWLVLIVYRPILCDPNRRHISLLFALLTLLSLQIGYFAIEANIVGGNSLSVLYLTISVYMVLILLVLRRVTMEVVNAFLRDEQSDEVYFSRPPRYNLAIFIILLFSLVEFFFPNNSVLGWLGLACGAAILGILNDFLLEDKSILLQPMVVLIVAIYVLMACGYFLLGFDYLYDGLYGINHFRHLLTAGAFSLSFYLVMIIVTTVHTGREFSSNRWINWGGGVLIAAACLRSLIAFYPHLNQPLYVLSALLWCLPFLIYLWQSYPYLVTKRVDGLPG